MEPNNNGHVTHAQNHLKKFHLFVPSTQTRPYTTSLSNTPFNLINL